MAEKKLKYDQVESAPSKIKNASDVEQFEYLISEGFQITGAGDTTVSFNAANKRITINSTPGSGGGGAVTSFNSRTGGVVATEGDYSLNLLGDVTINTPINNNTLLYNSSNTQWENKPLNTSVVPELTNLYFTEARTRNTPITGFLSGAGALTPTDTLLQAINKLDGNFITADANNVKLTGNQTITGNKTFTGGVSINTGNLSVTSTININADGVGAQYIGFSGNANNVGNTSTVTLLRKNDKLAIMANENSGTQKFALLDGSALNSFDRTFSFPDQSGTLALTSDLSNYVTLTGAQSITGTKSFNSGILSSIVAVGSGLNPTIQTGASGNGYAIYASASSTATAIFAAQSGTGTNIKAENLSSGNNIVANAQTSATGFNYVGQNNNTNTFTVDKLGNVTATAHVTTGGTADQLVGGDGVLQDKSQFQTALTNPVTGTGTVNFISKWTAAGTQGNSQIFDNGTNVGIGTTLFNPIAKFTVVATDATQIPYESYYYGAVASTAAGYNGVRSRGTEASPLSILAGDVITGIYGKAYMGSGFSSNTGAIRLIAANNYTSASTGSIIDFATTPIGGVDRVVRGQIMSTGNWLFNKETDDTINIIQANGTISALAGTQPNQVVVKSQLDALGIGGGTYSPVSSSLVNVTSPALNVSTYTTINGIVSVTVGLGLNTTTLNTNSSVSITLPISRNTGLKFIGNGVFYNTDTPKKYIPVFVKTTTTNTATLEFVSPSSGNQTLEGVVTFQYQI
jgi:Lower baseplate protein N-terminal domain